MMFLNFNDIFKSAREGYIYRDSILDGFFFHGVVEERGREERNKLMCNVVRDRIKREMG